jgi:hypothetical protein
MFVNRYNPQPILSALSNDQLRRLAPSIFASTPWAGMSERYRQVPTIEVVDMLRDAGYQPVKASQGNTRIPGKGEFTRHMIRFRDTKFIVTPAEVGAEIPELVLTNSHDGTSAYRFMAGIFRLICGNGLTVQSADFGSVSVRHSGGSDFQSRILDATHQVIEATPQITERINDWKQIQLSPPQQTAFAAAALELKPTAVELQPSQLLSPRRGADRKSDLWTTANVIQENVIKGGLRSYTPTGRRTSTRSVKAVDADLKFNRALWRLTEEMAKLAEAA